MSEPVNDALSIYEYWVREQLMGDAALVAIVGYNSYDGAPNIYFQEADEGAGDVVVIYDYAGTSENRSEMNGEIYLADVTMLVKAIGSKESMGKLRRAARRIHVALHRQDGNTPDGELLQCIEERTVVANGYEEDGTKFSVRGGYYNLWAGPQE